MSSESRVEQLVESILQQPPEQSESYLDEICAGHEDLRTEIRTILDPKLKSVTPRHHVVNRDDVRMIERHDGARFLTETLIRKDKATG